MYVKDIGYMQWYLCRIWFPRQGTTNKQTAWCIPSMSLALNFIWSWNRFAASVNESGDSD